ncbi:Glycosyltransferase involved in cell wall bisynthesis [Marinitoga hydrogenitolerans DSM 16785]|uniref:Glycosyltransferase involved in cell wall bisynthesis n=1 Tax=Marinitoga hydrogenitolerans (strain DSM 16785 / JCM 12826 / AT1271) TaxID=1122195 RepID=A0A1M4ZE53_MARH1|nr:glycosyltransferase [Marinitoga hydrogenitolerans]SHF15876.1 Glycosyltransferase involved in cell wall bisynthesis [Marinitoga hydrogenitolerans DSM 16785]
MNNKDLIMKLINQKKFSEAEDLIEKINDNFQKNTLKGLLNFNKGNFLDAKSFFEKALKINSDDDDALFNYAYVLKQLNKDLFSWKYFSRIKNKDWATYDLLGDIEINNRSKAAGIRYYYLASSLSNDTAAKDKYNYIKKKFSKNLKISFLCLPGLETFIKPIYEYLSFLYPSKIIISNNSEEIKSAVKWADIVWLEWANDMASFVTNNLNLKDKKVICRLHGYEVFTNSPDQINWDVVDHLFFVANHKRDLFYKQFGKKINIGKTSILRNGIDLNKFIYYKKKKPGKNLAIIGNINYRKGFEILLLAFYELIKKDSKYKLFIRGDFQDLRYKMAVETMIDELGLNKYIEFVPRVKNLSEWLRNMDYIVSSSIEESFHYTIGEAMAMGLKPVIHAWKESRKIWPEKNIFRNIEEFLNIILNQDYKSEEYRDFIEEKYPIEKQLCEIERVLNSFEINQNMFKNKKVLITIAVTNYNSEKYIRDFLDSVITQTYKDIELIIIDDASTDNSPKIIEEYAKKYSFIKFIQHKNNKGCPDYGRKEALDLAKGKYILFFDSDDMFNNKDSLQKIVAFMEDNPDYDYVYFPFEIIDENNKRIGRWDNKLYPPEDIIKQVFFRYGSGVLTMKGIFKMNFFIKNNINYPINGTAGDTLLSLICIKNNMKYTRIDEEIISYRIHNTNFTFNKQKRFDSIMDIIEYIVDNFHIINKDINIVNYFKNLFYIYELELWKPWGIDFNIFEYNHINYSKLIKLLYKYKKYIKSSEVDEYNNFLHYLENLYDKKNKPLVSILIPTHNRFKFFKQAFDSALNQTYENIEILVGDNSDNFETKEYIEKFLFNYDGEKTIKYYYNANKTKKNDFGLSNSNLLLQKAKGEYISFLYDDDLIHKEKIRIMMHFFILEKNVSLVTSYRKLIDEKGDFINDSIATRRLVDKLVILNGEEAIRKLIMSTVNFIGEPSTVIFRKKDVENNTFAKYKNIVAKGNWDIFQWVNNLEKGNLVYIPYALNYIRKHSKQVTHNYELKLNNYEDSYNLLNIFLENKKIFKDYEILNLLQVIYKSLLNENIDFNKKKKLLDLYKKKISSIKNKIISLSENNDSSELN